MAGRQGGREAGRAVGSTSSRTFSDNANHWPNETARVGVGVGVAAIAARWGVRLNRGAAWAASVDGLSHLFIECPN